MVGIDHSIQTMQVVVQQRSFRQAHICILPLTESFQPRLSRRRIKPALLSPLVPRHSQKEAPRAIPLIKSTDSGCPTAPPCVEKSKQVDSLTLSITAHPIRVVSSSVSQGNTDRKRVSRTLHPLPDLLRHPALKKLNRGRIS